MSNEDKVEEVKAKNVFEVVDNYLSHGLLDCCRHNSFDRVNIESLNSILDASIKFNQLTSSIQRQQVEISKLKMQRQA